MKLLNDFCYFAERRIYNLRFLILIVTPPLYRTIGSYFTLLA
jgi:hypothetical protein